MKQYAERDIEKQEYYIHHISAMTSEKLHSKSDIAAELAHRDGVIDRLEKKAVRYAHRLDQLNEANTALEEEIVQLKLDLEELCRRS